MAKRRKQTPAERDYYKQVKRIKQFIRRAEKRGYQFSEDVLPQKPKRVTQASVRKLAKLTPDKLYQKAVYGGEASQGEIIKGTTGLKLERKLKAQKSAETRKKNTESERKFWSQEEAEEHKNELPKGGKTIFQNILQDFILKLSESTSDFTPYSKKRQKSAIEESKRQKTTLYALTISTVLKDGEDAVGWRLQANPEVENLLYYVLYGSRAELIQSASYKLAEIIKGSTLSISEMQDLMEESELNESWEDAD